MANVIEVKLKFCGKRVGCYLTGGAIRRATGSDMFDGHYITWEGSDDAHTMVSFEKTLRSIYAGEQRPASESPTDSVASAQ